MTDLYSRLTGFALVALSAAAPVLPVADAEAEILMFDCYSRSTSDLLACLQANAVPVIEPPVVVAPAPEASMGASFLGSCTFMRCESPFGNRQ